MTDDEHALYAGNRAHHLSNVAAKLNKMLVLSHPRPLASLAGALESAFVLESGATLIHQLRKMEDRPDKLFLNGEEGE